MRRLLIALAVAVAGFGAGFAVGGSEKDALHAAAPLRLAPATPDSSASTPAVPTLRAIGFPSALHSGGASHTTEAASTASNPAVETTVGAVGASTPAASSPAAPTPSTPSPTHSTHTHGEGGGVHHESGGGA